MAKKGFKAWASRHQVIVWSVLFLASLPLTVHYLRSNNLKMVELTQNVIDVDKSSKGDIKEIKPALASLAGYVSNHMNTQMPGPVQLQYRYNKFVDRLVEEQESQAEAYRDVVYRQAKVHCSSTPISVRVECIQEYVASRGDADLIDLPPVEQFSYEYFSPAWSLDLAGVSTLASVLLFAMLIFVVITDVLGPRIIAASRDN